MKLENTNNQENTESLSHEFDKLIQEIFIDKVKNISNENTKEINKIITDNGKIIKDYFDEINIPAKIKKLEVHYTKENDNIVTLLKKEFSNLQKKQEQDIIVIKEDSENVKLTLVDKNRELTESLDTRLTFIEMKIEVLKKVTLFLGLFNLCFLIIFVALQIFLKL